MFFLLQGVAVQSSLGHLYLHGLGVPRDLEKARAYFQQGVSHADAAACNGLGYMLVHGLGGPVEVVRGIDLIKRASDAGFMEARFNLGMLRLQVTALSLGVADVRRQSVCVHSKDCRCRARVTPARWLWRAHSACVQCLRQSPFCARCCHSSQIEVVSTPLLAATTIVKRRRYEPTRAILPLYMKRCH